jgi:transcriptional regulator with XRE-family HTH domain
MVLVRWHRHQRSYWVSPNSLIWPDKTDLAEYIAVRTVFERYTAKPLPSTEQVYEYNFGRNLRLLRESRRISQAELGRRIGDVSINGPLAQSTIAYREGCSHSPNGEFTNAVARALGVMPFVLFLPLDDCEVLSEAVGFIRKLSKPLCK